MTTPRRAHYPYILSVVLLVLGLVYLALTGLYGEFGMMRLLRAQSEAEGYEQELRLLEAQQVELERDIRALSPGSLDLDMLEQQLRAVLGWGHPNDVLLTPEAAVPPRRANIGSSGADKPQPEYLPPSDAPGADGPGRPQPAPTR